MDSFKYLKQPKVLFDLAQKTDSLKAHKVHLIGFEFDGTACFRKGTRKGPDAIRDISDGIESYSPYLDLDTSDLDFFDLGNLPVGKSENEEKNWREATDAFFKITKNGQINNNKIKILTLGGEHSISYAPIKTYLEEYDDLVLIHLDAHADLRDGYEGHHYSHASIIKRSLDHFKEGHNLIQYGIRSGTKEEYQWMMKNKTLQNSQTEFLEKIKSLPNDRPLYLTLDLDYFDPAYLPGTGTPEAGGEDFHSFIKLAKILKEKNLVGADVVELSPEIDPTGNSDVFAAKVVRELILILN